MKKIFGIWVCIFFSVVAHTKANDSLQHKYHSWCFSFLAAPDLIGNAGKELEVSVRNGDRNSPLGLYFQADRGFKKYFSAGVFFKYGNVLKGSVIDNLYAYELSYRFHRSLAGVKIRYQRIIYFETGLMISAINYDRTYSRIPVSLNQNTYLSSSVSILGIVLGCGLIVPKKTGIVKFRAGAELRITNQFYAPEVLMPAEMVYEPYSSDTINLPQVYIPSKFPDLSPALSVQFGVVVYPFRQKN